MTAGAAAVIPTYLVVVEFGAAFRDSELLRLRALADKAGAKVVHVRTDRRPGLSLPEPNCAFEFSGFQDGLHAALDQTDGKAETEGLRIVFVNDTVFRAHLPGYGSALVTALLALRAPPARGVCVGIVGPVPEALTLGGKRLTRYISTWAFAVCAPRAELRQLRFFDDGSTQENFAAAVWPSLPASYRASVDLWLEPVHYLKGWYQAIPGRPLDEATRQRKRYSIYLEHTLALRAERAGLALVDIGAAATSGGANGTWAALKLSDRIYGNVKKLLLRARASLRPRHD